MLVERLTQVLKKYDKKIWIMQNQENSDRYFCKYISYDLATNSFCIVTQTDVYLLIHELDSQNLSKEVYNLANVHIIVYRYTNEVQKALEDIIASLKFPNEICLSYSTMADASTDILKHGEFVNLSKLVKMPYRQYSKNVKIVSAEKLMYELESQKTDAELKRLKLIASITDRILEETFENIKIGMTEKEIVQLTQDMSQQVMNLYLGSNGMVSYSMAWENAPIVLTGENFLKGGHSLASNRKLKYGDTIYFDFGLQVDFKEGPSLYTDMQRMGYAKRPKEKEVPKSVMKVFQTLVKSIEDGMEEMKPGIKAYKIDQIVRQEIVKQGYPEYNHATGHPVGLQVHDVGAVISPKNAKRSNLELVENGVYTLEPRISVVNGGSIEEMIQVTKFGGIPLCNRQKKLYIIQ